MPLSIKDDEYKPPKFNLFGKIDLAKRSFQMRTETISFGKEVMGIVGIVRKNCPRLGNG